MTEIKVGDTVRIKDTQPRDGYASKGIGQKFVVTALESTSPYCGAKPDFARGDKDFTKFGVYLKHLELVEADPRWRYNDHIVVYPETRDRQGRGRGVTVLDETPLPKVYTRWEGQELQENGEITEAARAYWAAHPAPKPAWHDAKPGEVWVVDADIFTWEGTQAMMVNIEGLFSNPSWSFPVEDGDITFARRIYPEAEE